MQFPTKTPLFKIYLWRLTRDYKRFLYKTTWHNTKRKSIFIKNISNFHFHLCFVGGICSFSTPQSFAVNNFFVCLAWFSCISSGFEKRPLGKWNTGFVRLIHFLIGIIEFSWVFKVWMKGGGSCICKIHQRN